MSTTEETSIRGPNKRKLSEQPDGIGPSAKRARNGEEDENNAVERDATQENSPSKKIADAQNASKDKKKRKKKRRKVSVVQQNGAGPQPAAAGSTSPVEARSKPASEVLVSSAQNGVAGSSRKSPSPSVASDRAKTPVSAPIRQRSPSPRTMFTKEEKGKARATSPVASNPTTDEDAKALTIHRSLLSNMLSSLTCHICLLLMSRPFALAPCGHVSCHSCLVNWFSNEPGTLGQVVQQAEPPAAQEAPNPGGPAANANAPPPPIAGPPPLVRRKKTCPQCRAVVREKPVEVWSVKDMVGAVVRSGLADPESIPLDLRDGTQPGANDASNTDPWKDIFQSREDQIAPFANLVMREHMGIRDEEDGGVYRCIDCTHEIWDAVCSSCGRFYPGHRIDFDSDSQDDDLEHLWMQDDLDDEDEIDHLNFFHHLVDADNLGQLGLGPHDLDEDLDDVSDDDLSDEDDHAPRLNPPPRILPSRYILQRAGDPVSEDEEDDGDESNDERSGVHNSEEEEGYESSFIDDDDDVVEVTGPSSPPTRHRYMTRSAGRRPAAIVISDSEDEDVEYVAIPRGPVQQLHLDSSDGNSEDSDDGLAAEVAAREQAVYGDDGSLSPRHMRQRHYDDNEDEDDEDDIY